MQETNLRQPNKAEFNNRNELYLIAIYTIIFIL